MTWLEKALCHNCESGQYAAANCQRQLYLSAYASEMSGRSTVSMRAGLSRPATAPKSTRCNWPNLWWQLQAIGLPSYGWQTQLRVTRGTCHSTMLLILGPHSLTCVAGPAASQHAPKQT